MVIFGVTISLLSLAIGVAIGWHIPMPPWAKWFFDKIGWKAAS